MECNDYDWEHYLNSYKDLTDAGLKNKNDAIQHYLKYGKNEKRLMRAKGLRNFDTKFDWEYYIESNADIKKHGSNKQQAIEHYLKYGNNENKCRFKIDDVDFIESFDWDYYINNNDDAKINGILNKDQAIRYYMTQGKNKNGLCRIRNKILKIVLMTKNEKKLIKNWIKYHGDRFGYNNIHIIDDSDDEDILKYYESIKELGITLYFLKSNLNQLEADINKVFKEIKDKCDFLIKLDTDEFLGVYDCETENVHIDKNTIQNEINSLPLNGLKYKCSYTMIAIPDRISLDPLLTVNFNKPELTTFKTFFLSKTYAHCDLGSHYGTVISGYDSNIHNETNFIIVHYHYQHVDDYIENTKRALISHNYIDKNDGKEIMIQKLYNLSISNNINSIHKVNYYLSFLQNPLFKKNYYDDFNKFTKYKFDKIFNEIIKKCIIITTINEPTEAIYEFIKTAYDIIIVGDKKTPNTYKDKNVIFLDLEKQKQLYPILFDLIPFNQYCRKNIGYLYAINNKYEIIAESDDDNIPYENWRSFENINYSNIHTITGPEFPNIYKLFTKKKLYPRGYPLDEVNNNKEIITVDNFKDIKIIQTVVDGDPDVDAITRLVTNDYITIFDKNKYYTFDRFVWTQLNTQNTIFLSKDIFHLLYLPCTTSFRVCDILKGYVLQRCLFSDNSSVLYTSSTVFQNRNSHNLLKDFKDEILLYTDAKKIINILNDLEIKGNINDLITIYTKLNVEKYVTDLELTILKEFIKCLN